MTATFDVSKHAISRALDMGVTGEEIRDAITRPREQYQSARSQSRWLTRERITLCVQDSPEGVPTVTTILWAKPSGWAADADFDPIEGRDTYDYSGARRVVRARKRRK